MKSPLVLFTYLHLITDAFALVAFNTFAIGFFPFG